MAVSGVLCNLQLKFQILLQNLEKLKLFVRHAGRDFRLAAFRLPSSTLPMSCANGWAEARIKIARMTLTIKLDGNWSSFQLANNTPPLSVTGSVIAPSARMLRGFVFAARPNDANTKFDSAPTFTTSPNSSYIA